MKQNTTDFTRFRWKRSAIFYCWFRYVVGFVFDPFVFLEPEKPQKWEWQQQPLFIKYLKNQRELND
jgi:hypothetical protein